MMQKTTQLESSETAKGTRNRRLRGKGPSWRHGASNRSRYPLILQDRAEQLLEYAHGQHHRVPAVRRGDSLEPKPGLLRPLQPPVDSSHCMTTPSLLPPPRSDASQTKMLLAK